MSVLIVDAGNTLIKAVGWDGLVPYPLLARNRLVFEKPEGESRDFGSVPTGLLEEDPGKLAQWLKELVANWEGSVVLVSVVPAVNQVLAELCSTLKVVGDSSDLPFPCDIEQPGTVGPDRYCNIAAAVAARIPSALVVDAGTATTFDLLLEGRFSGGLIAPGMAFAAKQLAQRGAMLKEVPFKEQPLEVGRNTRSAMMGGAWWAGIGGVEYTISRLQDKYGELPVILTGGLAQHLPRKNRFFDPFWTFRGAAFLATRSS